MTKPRVAPRAGEVNQLPPAERPRGWEVRDLVQEGIRICRERALKRANREQRPMVVVDRGADPELYGEGIHRFTCRPFSPTLVLAPHERVELIVTPEKGPRRGRGGRAAPGSQKAPEAPQKRAGGV